MIMSWYVLPFLAMNNVADCSCSHAILRGEFIDACVAFAIALPYGRYLLGGKFRPGTFLAARLPAFGDLIGYIVSICPIKQMFRITARWIVACVTRLVTVRERAIGQFVRRSMRSDTGAVLWANLYFAIPKFIFVALPFPTVVGAKNLDARPKSLCERFNGLMFELMPWKKAYRNAFDMSEWLTVLRSDLCFLSATTFAESIRNFKRWIVGRACEKRELWGMLLHSIRTSIAATKQVAETLARCRRYFLLADYSFILPQVSA